MLFWVNYNKCCSMEKLQEDWITNGLMDSEYKKYVLLAYFKHVQKAFNKVQLYPTLAELVRHYKNLIQLRDGKEQISKKLPKKISSINREKLELEYERLVTDGEFLKQLEEVMDFAIPKFKYSIEEGKEIYEFVEKQCDLTPIGLMPLYVDEGYFFLNSTSNNVAIYRYQLTVIEKSTEKYRGIHAKLINKFTKDISRTFESIKQEIIRKYKDLPNPATFLVQSKLDLPYHSTLLPVAKRLIVANVSSS